MSDQQQSEIFFSAKQKWNVAFWNFLHTISLYCLLFVNDEYDVCRAFESLEHLMPCAECKSHYTQFRNTHDLRSYIQEDRKLGMFKWTMDLHNYVNREMGAPIMSFQDALCAWAKVAHGTFPEKMESD